MERDLEFSLSEALLDFDPRLDGDEENGASFVPRLVDHEPHETVMEPMLLFRPPSVKKKNLSTSAAKKDRRKSSVDPPTEKHRKQWDGVISDFFSNKKRKANVKRETTLRRSRSFDTLHRRLKLDTAGDGEGWDEELKHQKPPETFVYQPPRRKKSSAMSNGEDNREEGKNPAQPSVPKRDFQLPPALYEDPVSILSRRSETGHQETPPSHVPGGSHASNGVARENSSVADNGSKREETEEKDVSKKPSLEETDQPGSKPGTPKLASKSSQGSASPPAPEKPARSKRRSLQTMEYCSPSTERKVSFTTQDLMIPEPRKKSSGTAPAEAVSTNTTPLSEDVGLLRIKLLGVRTPQHRQLKKSVYDPDSDEEEAQIPVVTDIASTDGLFCTLSINGKQSRFESSLQPLKPREQMAVWDQSDSEAVFFVTNQQQLFVTSRKLPLKDHSNHNPSMALSQNPKAECFGVGIYPISNQTPQVIGKEGENIENWAEVSGTIQETTIDLEPHGTVLLGMSYIGLNPNSKVTCNGSVTVKCLSGLNCFKNEEPCWICCTIDIDSENFGTTSSVLGMDDFLNKGFMNDPIEFSASASTACRIQVWGFGNDETEYWFGETYVPLAAVLPYSEHIVHQEDEKKPLKLLGESQREVTMPLEPTGTIGLVFDMSPAPELEESINEQTLQLLEASGIFTPAAIAHFRQQATTIDESQSSAESDGGKSGISTIPEETSSLDGNEQSQQQTLKKHFIPSRFSVKKKPAKDIYVSGDFDHLEPSSSITSTLQTSNPILRSLTRSLKRKNQSLRLLGNMKLQVPTNYQEKKFRQLPDDFDPYREIEVLKCEMKDVKAQLAETQFHREKAELKVKTLEKQVEMLKEKYTGKKKGRKYN